MSVVVFGSINMDLVVRSQRLPMSGETLSGMTFFTAPGGKGANQAVAAARMGAPTTMIGRVGGDVFGPTLQENLRQHGVDIAAVRVEPEQPSGVALITVEDGGANTIIVVAGANDLMNTDSIAQLRSMFASARIILLQLEIPLDAVIAAAQAAHEHDVLVMLDPAPVQALPDKLYTLIDIITPNQHEAARLVGFELHEHTDIEQAAVILHNRGVRNVIIKLGERGAYWFNGQCGMLLPPFPVRVVDTVAAGDAFNGALAAGLHENLPMIDALQWALAAGALAVTQAGAQPSLPDRHAVLTLLQPSSH